MASALGEIPANLTHYTSSDGEHFSKYMTRWSEAAKQTPAAILLPKSEDQCQQAVLWAVSNNVPFTCASGGMSLYSTMNEQGAVIDLSEYTGIEHNVTSKTAVLIGGIRTKEVAVQLAKDGHCTPLPSANTIGAIPFFLNGGNSLLVSRLGFASDCIQSARLVTAEGSLITVSEEENRDLLYAIRGAGQYFGLVTRLTVRTFTCHEAVDSPKGSLWNASFMFQPTKAKEVCEALKSIIANKKYATGGIVLISAPPPARSPAIIVAARLMGENAATQQTDAFKPLHDLQPFFTRGGELDIANLADSQDAVCTPGGFKKLALVGLHEIEPDLFAEVVSVWQDMVTRHPDAGSSWFSIIWDSKLPKAASVQSANCLHDVQFWANHLISTPHEEDFQELLKVSGKAFDILRSNQTPATYIDFSNSAREGPIERRYRGAERLAKLKALKKQWDPHGRFSSQLL